MRELADRDNVLSIIFESTHMMVAYLDTNLRFIRVNRAYAAIEKQEPAYFVGKAHFELYPNEENEKLFREVIETGEPYFSYARPFEYENNPERGVTHWDWSLVPTKNDDGEVIGAVLQLVDVTERIHAEEMLRIEQDFGGAVLATANALIIVLDKQGRIKRFNKACEQLTGYSFAEVHDRYVWEMLLQQEEIAPVREVFNDLANSAMPSQFTNYWVARDGNKILIDWNNSVLKNDRGDVSFVVSVGVDITEKQRAIDELKRSEETMESAQASAHIGTWDWDVVTDRLDWSDEIYRIFGETRESFRSTADHFLECVHPEDRSRLQAALEASLANPEVPYQCDHRIVRKSGDVRFVKESGKIYFDAAGKPVRMIGIVQDDTDNLRTAETVRYQAQLIDQIKGAIISTDLDGIVTSWNRGAENLYGYSADEAIGRDVTFIYPPDQQDVVPALIEQLKQHGTLEADVSTHKKNGEQFYIHLSCSFVFDSKNEPIGIVGHSIDQTDRIRAELQLQESNEFNSSVLSGLPIGVTIYDESGQCIMTNEAAAVNLGGTRDQMLAQNYNHNDTWKKNGLYALATKAIENNETQRAEVQFKTSFGKQVILDVWAAPITIGDRRYLVGMIKDISERKQAEEKIRNQAQIIDQIHDSVVTTDLDGNIVSWNKGAERIFGFSENEAIGKHISLIYPDSELEILEKDVISNLVTKGSHETESVMHRKNGERFVGHLSLSFLTDEHGNRIRMIGYTMDISGRKRVEEALRASEELLEGFFAQSLDGFFFMMLDEPIVWNKSVDKDALLDYVFSHQRMTKINGAMAQQYGGRVDQFIGLTPGDLFAHDIEYGKQLWRMMFDDGRLAIKTEEQKLDGTPIWIEGEYVCLYDDQGRIKGHFGVQREVTQQKQVEDEIRISESRLNEAQRIAKVGSWELDLQTNHLYWTDEIYSLFEIDKQKFGASYEAFLDAIHLDDREAVNNAYTQSLKDRTPYVITHRLTMPDGRIKWVEERCSTVFAEDGTPLVSRGTVQDITDRKLNETELEKYREKLEELVAERTRDLVVAQNELVRKERLATLGQLTATVSHELRNPLGAMRPSLYLVQRASDQDDEKVQRALERLDRNISRCDRIIDELLDFTRITVLERNDVLIDDWVQQVLEEQMVPAGINVIRDFGLKDASAQVDTNRLRRALINVIENGIQAMQDENLPADKKAAGELTIYTRDLGQAFEIGIRDTGVGIPENVLPHIFEPLYSTKGFGVGLGMPTVQQIVNQHGGIINVDTVPGEGTTVRMTLPKQAQADIEAAES